MMNRARSRPRLSPLGAITLGVAAGAAGTLAMDVVWFARYKRAGGAQGFLAWETAAHVKKWDDVSAPGQVGRRLAEAFLQRDIPDRWARPTTNLVHWATGLGWGAAYGVVAGSVRKVPGWAGLAFASVVWLSGYVVLPLAKVYRPLWEYDAKTLADDYSAHVAYGVTTSAAFAVLAHLSGRSRSSSHGGRGRPTACARPSS
jgi:hypothetical protein